MPPQVNNISLATSSLQCFTMYFLCPGWIVRLQSLPARRSPQYNWSERAPINIHCRPTLQLVQGRKWVIMLLLGREKITLSISFDRQILLLNTLWLDLSFGKSQIAISSLFLKPTKWIQRPLNAETHDSEVRPYLNSWWVWVTNVVNFKCGQMWLTARNRSKCGQVRHTCQILSLAQSRNKRASIARA